MTVEQRPIALITGGSRGIGAATARALAGHGYDVLFTYRNKATRAAEVATEIERMGARGLAVCCDITRQADLTALFATLGQWAGRLDTVVLNASGGLERDIVAIDPHYPTRINHNAQLAVVEGALPLLAPGSVVVFVTSHWAHLYGSVEQLPAYAPVAASKYAGEQALRARQGELAGHGIALIVVTGDLIEGTITPKLLERAAPGLGGERRRAIGTLPTASDMGEAIAAAAIDRTLPSGHTVVIGGALESVPPLASAPVS